VSAPADVARPTVLRAGAAFDGVSGTLRGPTEVLVIDGRIAEIDGSVSRPDGVEVVELGDRTLSPGFIDCHIHSQLTPERMLGTFYQESSAMKGLFALKSLRDMLNAGFTTVRDAASLDEEFSTVDLKRAVERGLVAGPRMIVCPHMLSGTSGHGETGVSDPSFHRPAIGVVDGADAIRTKVRQEVFGGADWIKVSLSGFFGFRPGDGPEEMAWTQAELDACVEAARDLGLDTCVHALGDESVKRTVRSGARSVEHASLASQEALDMVVEAGVYLVPTMLPIELFLSGAVVDVSGPAGDAPKGPRPTFGLFAYDEQLAEVQHRIAASDAMIAFGSDAGGFPHGEAWMEFRAMVRSGMTTLRALRAGTSVAGELLRRPDLGRLTEGATADVVAMVGDPLADIEATSRVEFVMQQGRVHRRLDGA
jgi:imidazolonepropionase-like amidohydrolase